MQKKSFRTKLLFSLLAMSIVTLLICGVGFVYMSTTYRRIFEENSEKSLSEFATLSSHMFYQSDVSSTRAYVILAAYKYETAHEILPLKDMLDSMGNRQLLDSGMGNWFLTDGKTVTESINVSPLECEQKLDAMFKLKYSPDDYNVFSDAFSDSPNGELYNAEPNNEFTVAWWPIEGSNLHIGFYNEADNAAFLQEQIGGLADMQAEEMNIGVQNILKIYFSIALGIIVVLIIVAVLLSRRLTHVVALPVEEAQQATEKELEAQKLLDKIKTEFLGNVSHELKTPLTVMSGIAQTAKKSLDEREDSQELATQMNIVTSEADRLALLVSQILDVTRIDEGRMFMQKQKTNIVELIQNTISTYYPALNKNNNKLVLELEEDLPNVLIDKMRISQVIVNIIANSLRHTQNGIITLKCKKHDEKFLKISIIDNGIGIEKERIPLIFDRFVSRDSKKSHATSGGTGLGLYICKHIVDAHGGEIVVESQINKGTEVSFTVPIQIEDLPHDF